MSLYSDMKHPATEDDRVWRALSDRRRRQMLDRLAEAPMTTGALAREFEPLCRTAVMKHLEVLVAARLVLVRWEGRVRWNHFNPVPIERISQRWIDRRRQEMSSALRRLKGVVETSMDSVETVKPGRTRR